MVIGNGGREHALAWKLSKSPELERLYVAPGNAGTKEWNVEIAMQDIPALVDFAVKEKIDLTVVGPEEPLSLGIVDAFKEAGLRIFGPTRAAAQLEGSKAFAKTIMDKAQVPTASYQVFEVEADAKEYIRENGAPCVIKADGLAAGKGVIVAMDLATALAAVDEVMDGFGTAGRRIIVEEYLEGQEVSLLCFADGKTAYPMVPVQDHKRALDGDQGLNTGGMGTYTPPSFWTSELETKVMAEIINPTLQTMADMGIPFQGVLFAGLMLTAQGPKVLEYNVRFGDPETQVVMLRLESDLLPILWTCTEERLAEMSLAWSRDVAVCVVMAAPGYPSAYPKGIQLDIPAVGPQEGVVFHAGTGMSEGKTVSTGGRVLGVLATAETLKEARTKAYSLVESIGFPEAHYRMDIGVKGLKENPLSL